MTEDNDVRASRPRHLHRGAVYAAAATLVVAAAAPVWAGGGHGGVHGAHGSNGKSAHQQHGTNSPHSTSTRQNSSARAASGPSGNNGTVKIHDVAGDTSPHNVPHVSCQFWVAFFGFDQGQTLNVSFTGQAPTGAGVPVSVSGAATTLVAPTPASGAGHDFDGDLGYTTSELGLSALGPAAKQGYHLKLAVSTGSGGGFKYKVFWLQPCASGATTTTVGGVATSATGATGATSTTAAVLGEHFTRARSGALTTTSGATTAAAPGTHVLGESFTRSGSLPFTGARITAMVLDALLMLGIGTALTVVARRRYTAATG